MFLRILKGGLWVPNPNTSSFTMKTKTAKPGKARYQELVNTGIRFTIFSALTNYLMMVQKKSGLERAAPFERYTKAYAKFEDRIQFKAMQSFTEIFKTILEGNMESSRNAARAASKFLYSSKSGKKDFLEIKSIVNDAARVYKDIKEDWRQKNFVVAVSVIYFLHDRENEQDFLFPWLFHLLQHSNGNIRQSAVRMFRNQLGPLTVHIRHPGSSWSYPLI